MKQMKLKFIYLMLAMMALPFAFSSCSSSDDDDDDTPNIEAPKLESEAAKYTITSAGAEYQSIELTASGNYIIIKSTAQSGQARKAQAETGKTAKAKISSFLQNPAMKKMTRSGEWDSGILYGTYTKVGENEYKLDKIGTLKVTQENGVACALELTTTNGTKKTYNGNKEKQTATSSDFVNFMCRTWNISHIKLYYKLNGKKIFDLEANTYTELIQKIKDFIKSHPELGDEEDDDDFDFDDFDTNYPKQIVITKNNTYMVIYEDNELAIANWKWEDESQHIFRYSWDEEGEYDEYSGTAKLSISGKNLIVTEEQTDTDSEDGETETVGMVYTLSEAK